MLILFVSFIIVLLIIECFSMILNIDDYGDHLLSSGVITAVLFGLGWLISLGITIEPPTEQQTALDTQWSAEEVVDKIVNETTNISTEPVLKESQVEQVIDNTPPQQVTKNIVVPTNVAFINKNRRNYDIRVKYTEGDACVNNQCFDASLIQHIDGSFWACKRNYGTCYQYK